MTSDPNSNPHHNPDQAEPDTAGNSPSGSSGVVIVDERGNPYRHQRNTYETFKSLIKGIFDRIPHGERLMIALTLVIAFSTVCQSVMFYFSNRSTSRQVDHIIVAADRIDDAADSFSKSSAEINRGMANAVSKLEAQAVATEAARESSIEESDKSLKATVENFRVDQRAWVGIQHVIPIPPDGLSGQIGMYFDVQNTGRTPAINVRNREEIEQSPNGSESAFSADYSDAYFPPMASKSVMMPNAVDTATQWSSDLQAQIIASIEKKKFFFHGRIAYDDVFGKHHWVVFCFYRRQNDPLLPSKVDWPICSSHNDIDK
jgi:hypothetical protein